MGDIKEMNRKNPEYKVKVSSDGCTTVISLPERLSKK